MEHFLCMPTKHFQWLIGTGGHIIDANIFVFTASGYHVSEISPMAHKKIKSLILFVTDSFQMHTVLTSKTRIFCFLNEVTLKTYLSKNIIYSNRSSTEFLNVSFQSVVFLFYL